MWFLFWSKYDFSKFATFLSFAGAIIRYGGVMCLFSGLIPGAAVCIVIGIGSHFLAERVNFSAWVRLVRSRGYEAMVKCGNLDVACQLIKAGGESAGVIRYISSLNPYIASEIGKLYPAGKKK